MAELTEDEVKRLAFLGKLEPEDLLCELLAVLRGDGGHHTDMVGLARAVLDAEIAWYALSATGAEDAGPETCDLIGIRPDGSADNLGKIAMPPMMKARELCRESFGQDPDDEDTDAAIALYCCEGVIKHMQAIARTQSNGGGEVSHG